MKSTSDTLTVGGLFSDFDVIEAARKLYPSIKHEIVTQLGLFQEETSAGQSTESHKEPVDKESIRTLIVSLSGDSQLSEVVYADEVTFKSNLGVGPSGIVDLVVGSRCGPEEAEFTLNVPSESDSSVVASCHVTFAETKQKSAALARSQPHNVSNEDIVEIDAVAQPVLQVLSLSVLKKDTKRPLLLFFANRNNIRPFVYYKDSDVFLTTDPFQWKKEDGSLDIDGVTFVSMLLCTSQALMYDSEAAVVRVFEKLKYPKSCFQAALAKVQKGSEIASQN